MPRIETDCSKATAGLSPVSGVYKSIVDGAESGMLSFPALDSCWKVSGMDSVQTLYSLKG